MTPSRTLTVRSPEDVLALVVSVLGFQPADSVVMVTRTATASFHARADLPVATEGVGAVAEHLADAAVMNHAQEAILVTYSGDPVIADGMTDELTARLAERGIAVDLTFREYDGRWYHSGGARHPADCSTTTAGTAYDLASHPFILESRYLDREIYRDRAGLRASLRGPVALVADTQLALLDVARHFLQRGLGEAREEDPELHEQEVAETEWALGRILDATAFSAEEIARLVLALGIREIRDSLWLAMDRATADHWCRRLKEVVRATPDDLVAEPSGLLAFASWLAGDGALAWCAVDLAREAEPDHTLASLVAQALESAVPPSAWEAPTLGTAGPGET